MEKDLLRVILGGTDASFYLLNKLEEYDFADPRLRLIFKIYKIGFKQKGIILSKELCTFLLKQIDAGELAVSASVLLESFSPVEITQEDLQILIIPIMKGRIRRVLNEVDEPEKIKNKIDEIYNSFNIIPKKITLDSIVIEKKEQILSPWDSLNEILPDSFNRGDLCLLLAGVNVGKTMFLCNLVKSIYLKNKRVIYLSCEDGAIRIKQRLLKILKDPISYFKGSEIDFSIVEQYSPPLSLINDLAKEADLLLIDYLDRIGYQTTEYRFMLRKIAEGLKTIADKNNCLIWTAKQIRRDGLQKQLVSMMDIGESFAVCESPDLILGFSIEENRCYLNIAKSRDVRLSDFVMLNCNTETQEITE